RLVGGHDHLHVLAVQLQRDGVRAVGGSDRDGEGQIRRVVVAQEEEVRSGGRVGQVVRLDRRVRRRRSGRRIEHRDVADGAEEVPHLLHRWDLRGELARLAYRRTVVVGGVDDRRGQPSPRGPAEGHVHVVDLDAVGDVGQVEGPLVHRPVEGALEGIALPVPWRAAPRVEEAAAELRLEAWRCRAGGGPAGRAADPEIAPVRRRAAGRRIAIEGVEVVALATREAARDPETVATLVVVVNGDGDAVGAGLRVQVRHVVDAGRRADEVRVLVLDLVQQDGAAAVGELVPGEDSVDRGQPFVGVAEVGRVVAARQPGSGGKPAGEPAAVHLAVDVGTWPDQHVEPGLRRHVQYQVHVADAAEVVVAGCGGVVVPAEVHAHRVVAAGLHLLQDVPPQRRAGQPERMEFAGPDEQPPAVDDQRVFVEGDGVPGRAPAGNEGPRGGRGQLWPSGYGARRGQCDGTAEHRAPRQMCTSHGNTSNMRGYVCL